MSIIRALIVDDEKTARDALSAILAREHPNVFVAGEASGVEDAYEQIFALNPQLVFLDIMMPGGNGFDLLKKFDRINFKVIFVTAFDDYTLEAIRFSAFDYLLKPVNTRELRDALQRLGSNAPESDEMSIKIRTFLNNYNDREKSKKKIVLKTTDSIHLTPIKNIIRCEADNNYSRIFLSDQPKILISKPLKHFEDMLENHGFLRIHQSHLVNLSHIIRIDKVDGGKVVLTDKIPLPISVRKREQVMKILEEL